MCSTQADSGTRSGDSPTDSGAATIGTIGCDVPVFCIEVPTRGSDRGATYGCSSKIEDAVAALERGRRRGVKWGEIVERKSAPRGMRTGSWLSPFDGASASRTHHMGRITQSKIDQSWTEARREARRELEASGVQADPGMDPGVRARIARDAYDSCQKERSKELLAGIPPIVLGKTKYRVIHGSESSLDLVGPRGGSSALVQSRNDPDAWAHNSMAGHTLKTVWYRRNPDYTFTRI